MLGGNLFAGGDLSGMQLRAFLGIILWLVPEASITYSGIQMTVCSNNNHYVMVKLLLLKIIIKV